MAAGYRVAVVGATGAVGGVMRKRKVKTSVAYS